MRLTPTDVTGIVVCVEYDDFLAVTLPKNKKHFGRLLVVTAPNDKKTQQLCESLQVQCHVTDAFYRNGAKFNKGAAIEEAFDVVGRRGWILLWDADIVFPDDMPLDVTAGYLYSAPRRMLEDAAKYAPSLNWQTVPKQNKLRFSGYYQLFAATDAKLQNTPWYPVTSWHAGASDSMFRDKWPAAARKSLPFCVLHLGAAGQHWCGRIREASNAGVMDAASQVRMMDMVAARSRAPLPPPILPVEDVAGVVVCVQYDDLLALTLPQNMHHFSRLVVVTTKDDSKTLSLCDKYGVKPLITDAFYRGGAKFNRGAAIEEGFDAVGRSGWIIVWDADIVFPAQLPSQLQTARLYSPWRRMLLDPRAYSAAFDWQKAERRNDKDLYGYFQMFHASDPVLQQSPWYGVKSWHAGQGDAEFALKWAKANRIRLQWDVLHLGPHDTNWCGRVSTRLDGETYDSNTIASRHASLADVPELACKHKKKSTTKRSRVQSAVVARKAAVARAVKSAAPKLRVARKIDTDVAKPPRPGFTPVVVRRVRPQQRKPQ